MAFRSPNTAIATVLVLHRATRAFAPSARLFNMPTKRGSFIATSSRQMCSGAQRLGPAPKVIDFGVAKAVDQKLTEKTLFTRLGMVVGTLEYMSEMLDRASTRVGERFRDQPRVEAEIRKTIAAHTTVWASTSKASGIGVPCWSSR